MKLSHTVDLSDPALGVVNVGHDLDGCYFSFTGAFCAHMASKDPANADLYLSQMMPTSHNFFELFGWDAGRFVAEYDEAMGYNLLAQSEFTFPGSVRALDRLTEVFGARLRNSIVTYRDNGATQFDAPLQTAQWAVSVGFPFTSLVCSKDKTVLSTDYFIEDSVANYYALRAAGTQCFLMARPWNEGSGVPAEHVVTSIEQYVDKIIEAEIARLSAHAAA